MSYEEVSLKVWRRESLPSLLSTVTEIVERNHHAAHPPRPSIKEGHIEQTANETTAAAHMTIRYVPSVDTLSVVGTRCQLHTSPSPAAAAAAAAVSSSEAAEAAAAAPLVTLEGGVDVDRHDVRRFVDAATVASWARRREPALPPAGRPLPDDYRFFGAAAEEEENETDGGVVGGVRWLRGGRTDDDRMDAAALCALAARLATRPLRRQRMGLVSAAKRRRRRMRDDVAVAAREDGGEEEGGEEGATQAASRDGGVPHELLALFGLVAEYAASAGLGAASLAGVAAEGGSAGALAFLLPQHPHHGAFCAVLDGVRREGRGGGDGADASRGPRSRPAFERLSAALAAPPPPPPTPSCREDAEESGVWGVAAEEDEEEEEEEDEDEGCGQSVLSGLAAYAAPEVEEAAAAAGPAPTEEEQGVIEKVARLVCLKGAAFEEALLAKAKGEGRFVFLLESDPLHRAYLEARERAAAAAAAAAASEDE